MLKPQTKLKDAKGFTIIEVLIVLAIAGLILLIVFLAVPALQRSSRNTQRKNDASSIGGAIANYISNNGGTVPTKLGKNASTSNLDVCNAGGGTTGGATACTGNIETGKLGYFTDGKVTINNAAAITVVAVGAETATAVSTNTVIIDYGYNCNDTNTGVGTSSPRTAAILYATESGSGNGSLQCVEQ